jgi:cell division protein FtsQ
LKGRNSKWKQLLPPVLWSLAGIALGVLLLSAVQRNNALRCSNVDIVIASFKNEMFISEADVQTIIEAELEEKIKSCSINKIDLRKLESKLQKDSWIKSAQLYIDNNQVLHVNVSERLPVARIFTVANRSFYIDSEAVVLPLSSYQVAEVPVFTNVPDRGKVVTPTDSIFWTQLSNVGSYILKDSFLLMQIGQLDITPEKEIELYPVIGNHVVKFGTPNNYQSKFKRLNQFYKQVLEKAGLNKYSVLDLRFDKQIVAKLRNANDITPQEPQINIISYELVSTQEEEPQQKLSIIAKVENRVHQKTAETHLTTRAKKDNSKEQPSKTEKSKSVRDSKKIVVASNNKPSQKALKQLPQKTDKAAIVEIDIRQKKSNENRSEAKAVMPKKQKL